MANRKELQKDSHPYYSQHPTTYPLGYLVPTYYDLLYPGDIVKGPYLDVYRLDELGYPVMDNLDASEAWFFVPLEQLYCEFEDFLRQSIREAPNKTQDTIRKNLMAALPSIPYAWTIQDDLNVDPNTGDGIDYDWLHLREAWDNGIGIFNHLQLPPPSTRSLADIGTAMEFARPGNPVPLSQAGRLPAWLYLAYEKIVDDHFIDPEMEFRSADWPLSSLRDVASNLFINPNQGSGQVPLTPQLFLDPDYWASVRAGRDDIDDIVGDGQAENGWHLRRARWSSDLLNRRRPHPQMTEAEEIASGDTIDNLREATAIQNQKLTLQRAEAGLSDLYDKLYGVKRSVAYDGISRRVHTSKKGLNISDVLQTSETDGTAQGHPVGYSHTIDSENKYFHFESDSVGILMRLSWVIPRNMYHFGIDPIWTKSSPYDYFTPKLRGLGWQPAPRCWVLPFRVVQSHGSGAGQQPLSWDYLNEPTGWLPAWESDRTKLSYVGGQFNILSGDLLTSSGTFARDYTFDHFGTSVWDGSINANFLKADPTARPFARTVPSEPRQVQHYSEYDFELISLVPKPIDHRDTLH